MKPRVLVVENKPAQAKMLRSGLDQEGFAAIEARNVDEAVSHASAQKVDAIIVDSIAPATTGVEVCHRIRSVLNERHVPIIMMIPNDRWNECACRQGDVVDDCIAKPFGIAELVARLRSAMGGGASLAPEILRYADITLDLGAFRITRRQRAVHLGPTEVRLLRFFLQHPRRVFSRKNLLDAIWGRAANIEPQTVDVHICRLRQAMNIDGAPNIIRTVHSTGYAMDIEPQPDNDEARAPISRRKSLKVSRSRRTAARHGTRSQRR